MSGMPLYHSSGMTMISRAITVESAIDRRIRLAFDRVAKLETLFVRNHTIDPMAPANTHSLESQ